MSLEFAQPLFFYPVSLLAILSGLFVVRCKSPVNSAIALVMAFVCLATYYVMLDAPFMAAVQILVYVGVIVFLLFFVIRLLKPGTEVLRGNAPSLVWGSLVTGLVLFQAIYLLLGKAGGQGELGSEHLQGEVETGDLLGTLFTDFLLPLEILSILLLVAVIGALVLFRGSVRKRVEEP